MAPVALLSDIPFGVVCFLFKINIFVKKKCNEMTFSQKKHKMATGLNFPCRKSDETSQDYVELKVKSSEIKFNFKSIHLI